jgi:hypothetical protein
MSLMRSFFEGKSANSDAIEQRSLTELLIDVAEGRKKNRDLTNFFLQRDWSKHETSKRVVHALLKVKVRRADLYPRAREIVEPIYMAR